MDSYRGVAEQGRRVRSGRFNPVVTTDQEEADMEQTVFNEGYDLSKLPYFDIKDGRLVIADPSFGPAIDAHTHIVMAFLLPLSVDLMSTKDPTEHYLPMKGRKIDFTVYQNKNFSKEDLSRMTRDLTITSMTPWGMRRTHTVGNLKKEMAELGITHSVVLAIDYPILPYNAKIVNEVGRKDPSIIPIGSVHPYALNVEGKIKEQVADGTKGIKYHPATQMIPPEHPKGMKLYRLCAEHKLPVFYHCGPVDIEPERGRLYSQLTRYEKPIAENPDVTFILGHSGALQMEQALDYSKRYPNVYLELSGQSLDNVRTIIEQAPEGHVMYGTDWPFYHQALALAKVLIATEGAPEMRRNVLFNNAAALFGIE